MKRFIFIISWFIFIILILIAVKPKMELGYIIFREFIEPNYSEKLEQKWNKKSSRYLLSKLKSRNHVYFSIAAYILRQRDKKEAVPILIKRVKSWNNDIKNIAFHSLGYWGDERAIEPLMNIIDKGPNHRDYIDALRALSIMRYEPVYPLIIEILESKESDVLYEDKPYAVGMLEYYAKPESIPLLDKIIEEESKKSKGLDIHWNIQTNAEDAIKNIKNKLDKK